MNVLLRIATRKTLRTVYCKKLNAVEKTDEGRQKFGEAIFILLY
jgi:hypothetical protein